MKKTICVYCASSTKINQRYYDAAVELGELIASKGLRLVNGAGTMGLMRACADAVLNNGGEAVGVIPQFMIDRNWHYEDMTELIVTKDMHERKRKLAEMADALIALPGGCGTFEELLEAITWKQLGIISKPIVILNTDGYYDPLIEMLGKAARERFMREEHLKLWTVASTPEEAMEQALTTPDWDASKAKVLARI
jgi:uncharacterized protein (TIGR00730 family)